MARDDFYKTLGVAKKALRRRDQEGLPQARARVPPGPQPGRQEQAEERFKEIQEAYAVLSDPEKRKQYDSGGMFGFGGGGRRRSALRPEHVPAGAAAAASATSSPTCSAARRPAAAARRASAAATSRPRCSSRFDQAIEGTAGVGHRARSRRPARPATAPAPSPAPAPTRCPQCDGPRRRDRGPGHVLDLASPARAAAAAAR